MKYCMNYNQITEHMDCIQKADEWTIEYNPKDSTLLEFLELNKNRRINLHITKDVDIEFLYELCNKYKNLYIKMSLNDYTSEYGKLRLFFQEGVDRWDIFVWMLGKHVTDIYIINELGFSLDKLAIAAHKLGVKLRVYPNVAQTSAFNEMPALKKFFIRPEDIDLYSDYIDTCEFYNSDKKLETYYKIYKEDKKWFGKLNEIIIDFNSEIDNKYIIPRFAEKRIRCNKSCIKGGYCHRCDRIEELSHTLEQSKLIIKVDNKDNVDKN